MKYKRLLVVLLLIFCFSCKKKGINSIPTLYLHQWNEAYEKAIINDFFNPPLAGRMYTYPNLAVYAIMTNGKGKLLKSQMDFPSIKFSKNDKELISLYTFYWVGKKMVYSFNFLDDYLTMFDEDMLELGFSKNELTKSKKKAKEIATEIIAWSKKDNYKETRSDTKFVLSKIDGSWKPTPPDFFDGLEPSWSRIRTFFIDSANQFTEKYKPYPFDIKNKNSNFYIELLDVKNQVAKTENKELATAKYWDCNPLAPQHVSHMTYAEKKLTPGGHWMNIMRSVSIERNEEFNDACKAYALMSLAIHDGFVACWQAKYYYDYIRPITAIQENWDSKWNTLILTPNFPEYPSGHSVISGVASTILTMHYGDNLSFTDRAEEPFGMPARTYSSFNVACDQAAMSRYYAGIHFKKAIIDGVEMGRDIGQVVIEKINSDEETN